MGKPTRATLKSFISRNIDSRKRLSMILQTYNLGIGFAEIISYPK